MICHPPLKRYVVSVCLALVCAASGKSDLLVYEGFAGYTGTALAGQTPNASTVGLDSAVVYYDGGGTRTAGYTLQASGLSFAGLQTGGGALAFATGTNVMGADIATSSFTGTLWSSYLVRIATQGGAAGDGVVLRVGSSPADSTNAHLQSWADVRTSSTASKNVSVSHNVGTLSAGNGSGALATNTTYIIISSFTNVGVALSGGTAGVAKLWAMTESQFSAFLLAGGTENELNSASVTATATQTSTSGTAATFNSASAFGLVTVNATGVFDEIRFGSALADVIPSSIPEPAGAAAIAGLLGGALAVSSRRGIRAPGNRPGA